MAFWQTGYLEFHEPEEPPTPAPAPLPTESCPVCGALFFSRRDLDVHQLGGHVGVRPTLIFQGREAGRSRLHVATTTRVEDWVFHDSIAVEVNGASMTPTQAAELLASRRTGHVDVIATGDGARREFEFEFALAEEGDLEGVDGALEHLIAGRVLDRGAIAGFITRSEPYVTARRYLDGLSNYLYGVLAREDLSDRGGDAEIYERRYDISARSLGAYDRRPAEAICGLVAFHYNQFDHAVAKTKSWWVSDVSKRFLGLLADTPIQPSGLSDREHSTLDAALSDTTTHRLLQVGSLAIDGSKVPLLDEMLAEVAGHRPSDQLKIRMIAAEHALAGGRLEQARAHADELRQSVVAEGWYAGFRARCEVRP